MEGKRSYSEVTMPTSVQVTRAEVRDGRSQPLGGMFNGSDDDAALPRPATNSKLTH
jgi:hypothetical protein